MYTSKPKHIINDMAVVTIDTKLPDTNIIKPIITEDKMWVKMKNLENWFCLLMIKNCSTANRISMIMATLTI